MTLPAGFRFSSTINNKTYTFKTRQTLIATNNGSNQYYFQLGENQNFAIYEGKQTRKVFIAGPAGENVSYVIPTESLDLNTVKVNVYADTSTTFYDVYTNLNDTVNIDKNSRIFVVKEAPNGQFELSFGNGARLGKFPSTGNKIEVIYDEVAGPLANGGRTFTPLDTVQDGNGEALTANVTTIVGSMAGQNKESIESIRKNAPYLYATQNRMVTAQDYASLVLRKYSNLITDIKSWGGEDNLPPRYGSVYLSIVFNTLDTEIQSAAKSGIQALAKNLSVASFDVQFTDPTTTYLEVQTTFQWNPNLTTESQTAIETLVNTTVENYFNEQLGGFDKSFRRSNLLTVIDDAEPSILSSRADVKMQYRFIPVAGTVNYTIDFPAGIADPDNTTFIVRSDNFYIGQKVCYIRNRLNTKIIEVIDISTGSPLIDNIGEYNATTGQITLSNFTGVLIAGTPYIKITAIPANQATINASRSDVLAFDNFASSTNAIITDTV